MAQQTLSRPGESLPEYPEGSLMTVQAVADKFRVSTATLRRWIKENRVPYQLVGPRKIRHIEVAKVIKPIGTPTPMPPTPAKEIEDHEPEGSGDNTTRRLPEEVPGRDKDSPRLPAEDASEPRRDRGTPRSTGAPKNGGGGKTKHHHHR